MIDGVKLFKIKSHVDSRGVFKEVFLLKNNIYEFNIPYVQENESISNYAVFRGLHFQKGSFSQNKLLRISSGLIFDIMIDLRKESKSFLKVLTLKLDNKSIWGISIAGITKILDKIYTILSKKYMYNPMNTIYLANT